ncbi:protein transport protein Sec31A-like isoform X2 [Liolophura sinensis]|uniref:protein transport protein Sec31A-like isoform X2 n=1 Tax=Liolophura sinensis TaxID=3198878 RepID=UPI00315849D1
MVPPEEVACVAWNRQVQHILASTFTARCVVWDLRKNEPVIKISDSMSRIKCKTVAWHPDVATQLCLSSEDDHTPVIQLWDLRFATSPLKVFENHQRGILSMAWCLRDPDMLLSCGKDNRILCWNPNTNVQGGEVIYELPTSNQWSFDVQWCPRNPNIISSSSFDGHITVFSLMGGGHPLQPSNRIAASFDTDLFGQMPPAPVAQTEEQSVAPLTKPPKWLRKPVGASFAFGGKLVTFEHTKPQNPQQPPQRLVNISQVVTETDLLSRSTQLEQALQSGQLLEFCSMKASNSENDFQENIWNFLRVNFETEPRPRYLQLLGYDQTDLAKRVAEQTGEAIAAAQGVDASELARKMSQLGTEDLKPGTLSLSGQASPSVESKTPNDSSSRDELSDQSSAFDEIAMNQQGQPQQTGVSGSSTPLVIPGLKDKEGLMTQALLMGNFEAAVEMCLHENNMAEAILLAIAGGPELLARTQKKFFQRNKSKTNKLVASILSRDWRQIVEGCDLNNWKEALAVIVTYASNDEFTALCDMLGSRLEKERRGEFSGYASLCYICSGNVNKLVDNWMKITPATNTPGSLQDLVEKVMILRKAVEIAKGQAPEVTTGTLASQLSSYSGILAAQGSLTTAMNYLGNSSEVSLAILRDRLYKALGPLAQGYEAPPFPFQRRDVNAAGIRQTQQAAQAPQQQQQQQRKAPHTYQTQAVSGFQTTTTPSVSSYYNPTQYTNMNGGVSSASVYNPTVSSYSDSSASSSAGYSAKGGLGHRYPSYPQSAAQYGIDTYSPQQGYNQTSQAQTGYNSTSQGQTGYNQQTPYSQQSAFYNPSGYNAPVSLPNVNSYTQNQTPGGPYSQANSAPLRPAYQDVKPVSAWNDPPIVGSKKAAQYEAPNPITNPIFGSNQPQAPEQGPPGAPNYSQFYNPAEHQPAPQPAKPVEPPKPVEKGPIPQEHVVLKEIFDGLVNGCMNSATNAQVKRKLEDVIRKLEILYDRLRESSLSQNVTLGLHQIIQSVQQGDYNTGLAIYTQMISQGNFSEISSFMPALKVLLQTSAHLQVYVQ